MPRLKPGTVLLREYQGERGAGGAHQLLRYERPNPSRAGLTLRCAIYTRNSSDNLIGIVSENGEFRQIAQRHRRPSLGVHPALGDHLAAKCAIFSMSQISWSNAGPRGPAVMMLVLSNTGAPVALVSPF